jgi:hypothetical protein
VGKQEEQRAGFAGSVTRVSGNVTGNKSAPLAERGDDLYQTPSVAVQALMRVEKLPKVIWEPACGASLIRHAGTIR